MKRVSYDFRGQIPQFKQDGLMFRGLPMNGAAWTFIFNCFFGLFFLYTIPGLGFGVLSMKYWGEDAFPIGMIPWFGCAMTHLIWYALKLNRYKKALLNWDLEAARHT